MMEFDNESQIEIPVMKRGVSYAEPRATNNSEYNPFLEEQSKSSYAGALLYSNWDSEFEKVEKVDKVESEEPLSKIEWSDIEFDATNKSEAQPNLLDGVATSTPQIYELSLFAGRYAWCKIDDKVAIVDLKRAKERLSYDHYLTTLHEGSTPSQQLLFPIELRLSNEEYLLISERAMEFSVLGFDVELCGNDQILLKGLPADLPQDCVDKLIYELLQILATPKSVEDELRERMAQAMAYRCSSVFDRGITLQQATDLVGSLLKSGNIGRTPRGGVIMRYLTRDDIERLLS